MKKWQVGWGPISSCNMACKFCYSERVRSRVGELGFGEWKTFIDNNHDQILSINYGTGENSLSNEWFRLVHYIRKNYPSIEQALTTNGYLGQKINDNHKLKEIVNESIDEIDLSLDFCNPLRHNEFRGQEMAFDWVMNTLQYCIENEKAATIVFLGTNDTLEKGNLDGLFAIARRFNAKLRMNIYRPTNGIDEKNNQFIASYEKIIEALYYIEDNYKILAICDSLFNAILTNAQSEADPSGESSLRILSDGSITPSTYLISENFRKANITEDNVLEKIESNDGFHQIINSEIPADCRCCSYASSCSGGVFDRRYLWYNTFTERDPYCPFRENKNALIKKVEVFRELKSIHDGYLPTMFFSNK